ncbi:helix-turn-helix transcriptional regulator [Nesterenkonia halotolerans]|nr:helix-turn-helix transcriptional regulator [Nesterenkonia halotolerans]
MALDRSGLAQFLRRRRQLLQPEDVGLPRGERRRTGGLRREEIASLCHMSTDYYTRLEQQRATQPSEQMIASIAQGFHLSLDERDHLFRLAGRNPPSRGPGSAHISPGLLRILDRLNDTPAEIVTELGQTLKQTPLGVALTGNLTSFTGPARSIGYRWFTDPGARELYRSEDHPFLTRLWVSHLRQVSTLRGPRSEAAQLVNRLFDSNREFRDTWNRHEVGLRAFEVKHFVHPQVGALELNCQTLLDGNQPHMLLVYTATPGSESYEKLQLLSVLGV